MIVSLLLLISAIFVNSVAVYLHKMKRILGYSVKKHMVVITPFWALFVASLAYVAYKPTYPFDRDWWVLAIGIVAYIGSLALFARVYKLLGAGALSNLNLFQKTPIVKDWTFTYLRHPMYISYSLAIISLGLIFGTYDYFIIGAVASVGLFVEGEIEAP